MTTITTTLAFGWPWYEWQLFLIEAAKLLWVFGVGACIGSLMNVLVYRVPLGLNFITPSSRCPSCQTKLTWRENIPIFGWVLLRGKCRFCRSPISPEYPIVETVVACLFALTYLWINASQIHTMGHWFAAWQPTWGLSGLASTWPTIVIVCTLFALLVAMTMVDAKTCTIPAVFTNIPAVVGGFGHVVHALIVQKLNGQLPTRTPGWDWTIPTPNAIEWPWIGAALGGAAGLVLSNLLLHWGIFQRSFADAPEWEAQELQRRNATNEIKEGDDAHPTDLWIAYPHARREVTRELIFLGPVIGLALLGASLAIRFAGPWNPHPITGVTQPSHAAPLWLMVLAGVLLGYLIGGGIVWLMRIFGSLVFGKEALGIGDVHMMAAVGACLGWINPVIAFFAAALLGVAWWLGASLFFGKARRALPYGPYLAAATILVFFARPWIEKALSAYFMGEFRLP